MEMNRIENLLITEVLGKSYVLEVHSSGVIASVFSEKKEIEKQEVPAFEEELLERSFEVTLELILNNSFGDLEQVDDVVSHLESELQEKLLELVQVGQKTKRLVH